MYKTIYSITIESELPLTDDQAYDVMENLAERLNGYETKCPEYIKDKIDLKSLNREG